MACNLLVERFQGGILNNLALEALMFWAIMPRLHSTITIQLL